MNCCYCGDELRIGLCLTLANVKVDGKWTRGVRVQVFQEHDRDLELVHFDCAEDYKEELLCG